MKLDRDRSALVLVDYQDRLWPALVEGASVVKEAVFLARVAQALGVPVLGTEQNQLRLGPNAQDLRSLCAHTLSKHHFDATADGLLDLLQSTGRPVSQVVVAGCEAHVCLMQTALGLLAAGLQVAVVPEACASRRPSDKALGMQRLSAAGAVMLSAEMLAFEWLRTCEDPHFRHVLSLIKARPV
jgi:nicotinamidase-related amidase